MKYPSVRQSETLTEQLRLMKGFFKTTQAKGIKDLCTSMQNTLASFSKEGKNEGIYQGERGGVWSKIKVSHVGKKGHRKHVYSNSFSTGKTPSRIIVYSEPQNTVLKSLSARTERKSQAELQENKPTEYQVISTAFRCGSNMLCLVFTSFSRLLSVKTLISMYIYPSI